jgi:hypothetical protein
MFNTVNEIVDSLFKKLIENERCLLERELLRIQMLVYRTQITTGPTNCVVFFLQAIAQVQHEENAKLNEEIERLRSELTKVWVDSVNQILFLVLLQALQAPQTHPDGKYGPPSPHIPHTKEEAM